ncbi:DUF2189 domain-containing protein [Parasphingopyxis algicola]|uniref:DUF2189 domain-containing protein n=1 Tax=Parasphingopyxis algicola TaxID=2026624 RepID=UPI00159F7F86|nr:DUF2189 domain-containing protein [Parasphingopyxis algicola]QLC24281.1 DUF2189 domain-containing protein [Parasphingopyxis algicola]
MSQEASLDTTPATVPLPVRTITAVDLNESLAAGYADFKAKRGDLIFVGLLYPLVGAVASVVMTGSDISMLFPLFAGLSLLGPLVATGFYELAKRREAGRDSSWWHFFGVLKNRSILSIAAVGVGLLAIFGAWLAAAALIYTFFFGLQPPGTAANFAEMVLTTQAGWGMIVVGNLVGLLFAIVVLAVSVVSLPLLVDRKVSAERAVATSLAAFRRNPAVLLRWGVTVGLILTVAAIPLLIGLAVALPVLGYATWHLYTRLVDRDELARMGR